MIGNPDVFVHSEVFYGVMNELALAADDPFLGLHVADEMELVNWPVLTNLLESARSVGEFLIGFVQNVPRHSTSVEHSLSIGPKRSQYRIVRTKRSVNAAAQSDGFGAGLYLRVFEAIASTSWVPEKVTLLTSYPEAIPPSYREAEIKILSEAVFAIEFPTQILFEDVAFNAAKLSPLPVIKTRPTLVSAIRAVTPSFLDQGTGLKQSIAEALGVSVDLMERTLVGEGTSLSREIRTVKCEVSCELLADTDRSISDIGAHIGYSEPANFTRFFKSQLGVTPNQFRKDNKNNLLA